MTRPWILDLFCKAGGAGMGYHRAGFDVVGVDIEPQPNYPFTFVQGDVLGPWLSSALLGAPADAYSAWRFDAIHASPPCQAHSTLKTLQGGKEYPDLIGPVRELLEATGLPYVIENVEGAPLLDPVWLCGCMFPELRVYRKRGFESNVPLAHTDCWPHDELTFTHDKRKRHYGQPLDLTTMRVQVTGGGNAPVWAKAQAMGIDWMTGRELNEAIPPAYTREIGQQLLSVIDSRWVAA